jgi:hypothetical protein
MREGGHVATDGSLLAREVLAALAGGSSVDHPPGALGTGP